MTRARIILSILNGAWLILFGIVILTFSLLSPVFLTGDNGLNILVQASPTAILAVGMTFVLLTAGVDLSVGSVMYLAGLTAGLLGAHGVPLPAALGAALLVGLVCGAFNGLCVAWLRVIPFVVTLAVLHMGRGLGLLLSETKGVTLPESYQTFGAGKLLGIPGPLFIFLLVLLAGHVILQHTPFGRHLYAVGQDEEAARKAGINTRRLLFAVYVICGLCAAIGALVALTQTGSVASRFGAGREFAAIAAAVLGGTSLFGGRGNVFPGTFLGALLIQTVENGLVLVNADPYLYPLITATVIFAAVLVDSQRRAWLDRLARRQIRNSKF